ncbi:MAG TPA: molybdenum cofactor guanylyltransferase [Candidatus Binatia bacterium]|nr:molybdenum cofactor guanylyltransferase [Candidatus Binatia bacterium]
MDESRTAIVMLAGGAARRFPGKLEREIDGEPMILRCYRNLRATALPIYVAANRPFAPLIDAQLDAPRLIDRDPGGGPLRAFASACGAIDAERCFAVAADQPNLDASVLRRLLAAWQPGDDAVVPLHEGLIEPLAALYDRAAVVREDAALRKAGKAAMHDLVACIAARLVPIEPEYFCNVNRPSDLAGATGK